MEQIKCVAFNVPSSLSLVGCKMTNSSLLFGTKEANTIPLPRTSGMRSVVQHLAEDPSAPCRDITGRRADNRISAAA